VIRRRLFNLATVLSALLSLAAATMRVRSGFVADVWELRPRSALRIYPTWCRHRIVQSSDDCLTWITYDEMEYTGKITPPFYRVLPFGLAPAQRGEYDQRTDRERLPPGTVYSSIPGVAEWYTPPRSAIPFQWVAVQWRALIIAGAVLPLARWLWSRRRVRAKAGPAFPIISPEE
jgi:hypothetical protein